LSANDGAGLEFRVAADVAGQVGSISADRQRDEPYRSVQVKRNFVFAVFFCAGSAAGVEVNRVPHTVQQENMHKGVFELVVDHVRHFAEQCVQVQDAGNGFR